MIAALLLPLLAVVAGAQQYPYQNNQNNPQLQNVQPAVQNNQNNNNPQFQQNQQYQQQQYQNQYSQNGQQQYQRPSGLINQPLMNTYPDTTNQLNQTGAAITLQLKTYSDPGLRLPGGMTCTCPQAQNNGCPYLRTTGPQCYFSFTTIISAPDSSVQYIATEFVPLDTNGNIDLTRSTTNWTQPQTLYLSSKPSGIDIFVHHLGVVINQQTSALQYFNNLVHVDTFVQPLKDYLPGVSSQITQQSPATLAGQIMQTSLSLTYSVQCRNNFVGRNCDLTCTAVPNTNTASCVSNVTGYWSICNVATGGQMDPCTLCANGISNGRCQGAVTQTGATTSTDNSGFRVATIILGCLLGLALIIIIALIVFFCIARHKESQGPYRTPMQPQTSSWSRPAAARPLLSDTDPYPTKTAEANSQDWGYQPHVVSVNNQRSAPMAEHDASRSTNNDDQQSHSSYNTRPSGNSNGNPVALARREAQV